MNDHWIEKGIKGNGDSIILGNVPAYSWRNWVKVRPQNLPDRTAGLRAEI